MRIIHVKDTSLFILEDDVDGVAMQIRIVLGTTDLSYTPTLEKCKNLQISKVGVDMRIRRDTYLGKLIARKHNGLVKVITLRSVACPTLLV